MGPFELMGYRLTAAFICREGRPSGDAYIELCSLKDVKEALKLNNRNMGKRYIEGRMDTDFAGYIFQIIFSEK